jgi:hypothetical protein
VSATQNLYLASSLKVQINDLLDPMHVKFGVKSNHKNNFKKFCLEQCLHANTCKHGGSVKVLICITKFKSESVPKEIMKRTRSVNCTIIIL